GNRRLASLKLLEPLFGLLVDEGPATHPVSGLLVAAPFTQVIPTDDIGAHCDHTERFQGGSASPFSRLANFAVLGSVGGGDGVHRGFSGSRKLNDRIERDRAGGWRRRRGRRSGSQTRIGSLQRRQNLRDRAADSECPLAAKPIQVPVHG